MRGAGGDAEAAAGAGLQRAYGLYASGVCRHGLVNLSLTFSFTFLVLIDPRRNRLAGGLTKAPARLTPGNTRKNTERDAVAAVCAAAFPAARTR